VGEHFVFENLLPFVDEHFKKKPSLVLRKLARFLRHALPSDWGIFKLQGPLGSAFGKPLFW
jgi:hypothetical protein